MINTVNYMKQFKKKINNKMAYIDTHLNEDKK